MILDLSLWPASLGLSFNDKIYAYIISVLKHFNLRWSKRQGALAINEACDLAKSILNGNSNSLLLALQPIHHASTDRAFVVRNRRALEDLLGGATFGCK